MGQKYDETVTLPHRYWPEGLKQPEGCPCGWEDDGENVRFTLRRGCPVHRPEPTQPPRPKQWYDRVPDGLLAIVVEHGRVWHKNCPKDSHASGIMGQVSKRGADGLARVHCYSCAKEGFLPAGSGRILIHEIQPIEPEE